MVRIGGSRAAFIYGKIASMFGSNIVWDTLMVNRNAINPWIMVLAEANGQRKIIYTQKKINEDKLLSTE